MKNFINYVLALFFVFNFYSSKVIAISKESIPNKSQILIAKKYAEKYCTAKDDKFFKGLDNERTLKYSYFKYIGLQNGELSSKDMYKTLIHQIRKKPANSWLF